jgi:hypothetical protein
MLRAASVYKLTVDGQTLPPLPECAPLSLRWPAWYSPDSLDRQRDAATISTLVEAGQLSRETGLQVLAPSYDIEDIPAELARINAERTT